IPAPPGWFAFHVTVPATGATIGSPLAATTSCPWWMWPGRPAPKRASSPPKLKGPCTGKTPETVVIVGAGVTGFGVLVAGLLATGVRRTTFGLGGLCPERAPPTPELVALCAGVTPGAAPPTEPSLVGAGPTASLPGAAPPAFAAAALAGSAGAAAPRAMRRRVVARMGRAIPRRFGCALHASQPACGLARASRRNLCSRSTQAASNRESNANAPPFDSGSLRFPHFGDCTHDGHPRLHLHSAIRRCASPTSRSKPR